MTTRTVDTLQDLTGYESGVIIWDDGETWALNWVGYNGLPRVFGPIAVGLGEIVAVPVRVPAGAIRAVRAHELAESGTAESRRADLRAWRVGNEATIVVSANWH